MSNAIMFRRAILARFPWALSVDVESRGPQLIVHVGVSEHAPSPREAAAVITVALEGVREMGMECAVSIGTTAPPGEPALSGPALLASIAANTTRQGLQEGLVRLVPGLGRLVMENVHGGLRFLVSDESGVVSTKLLEDVTTSARALCGPSTPTLVLPLPPGDARNDLANPGFIVPRADPVLRRFAEEELHSFARDLPRVLSGTADPVAVVDGVEGTAILCTSTIGGESPVPCFLPLYDRLFLSMPPVPKGQGEDEEAYLQRHFGLGAEDFYTLCKRGKLVPIFKFAMGAYPIAMARRFIEDLALRWVSPRVLDLVSARYAWGQARYLRVLRGDRDLSAKAHLHLNEWQRKQGVGELEDLSRRMLEFALVGVEQFEGIMWHQGHLAVEHFSPGAPLLFMAQKRARPDDESMVAIDAMTTAHTIALGQAFGASTYAGMNLHPAVMDAATQFFAAERVVSPAQAATTQQLIDALELSYGEHIPIDEYLDLFDRAETRRVRAIVAGLLDASGGDQRALRDAVHKLNDEVARLAKRDLLKKKDVDVVGDLSAMAAPALGTSMMAQVIAASAKTSLAKAAGVQLFDTLVEDTAMGDLLDRIRGPITGTSAAGVRLFRIRGRIPKS